MAVKTVTVNIISHPLSRQEHGVTFKVKTGGAKYGELVVSKGGIRWKPRNKRKHHFIGWKELNAIAEQ